MLVAGNVVLAETSGFAGLVIGTALWGAHMALTQGIFARMIADSAPEHVRATSFGAFWFVTGIASLLASLGAGWLWDRQGSSGDLPHQRRRRGGGAGDAELARRRPA